jgi:hypothetical protein
MSKTGYEKGAPAGRSRERLIEQVAVDALKRAEQLDEEVLALSAQGSMTAEEVADIRRALAERWVDTLGTDSVWLTEDAGQAIRASGVGHRVYDYWTAEPRIASWAFDRDLGLGREGYDAWVTASDKWTDPGPHVPYPARLEKLFPAAQKDAARNLAHFAEKDAAKSLVRQVCIEVTAENGFAFWRDNYAVLWAKYTSTDDRIIWKSYIYPRGEGPAYVNN